MSKPAASRPTHVRYYVLTAICLITVINYIQRNSPGGVVKQIQESLQTDKDHIGFSGTGFFIAYALMQIPSGKLAQRWGPRRALTIYALGWSLVTAAMAHAASIWGFIGLRTLLGGLQAGIFPCATLIMVAWLPSSRRGLASALLNSCMLIGAGTVSKLTGYMLKDLGWRTLLSTYALPGVIWAVWFFIWFRDRPEYKRSVNQAERDLIASGPPAPKKATSAFALAFLLSVPLWLICIQQGMRAGASRFVDQWLPTYLQEVSLAGIENDDLRQERANHLTAWPEYIGVVSGPIGGFISDWVLRRTGKRRLARNGVAIASLGIGAICFLPMFLVSSAELQVLFITLGTLVSTCAAPCAYALTMDVGGKDLPVVFGAMNMMGNFGAAAITGLVSPLNRWTGGTWQASLVLFVAIHVIALLCWLVLNPDRPINPQDRSATDRLG